MSFKPEVIADSSGKWCDNALRFATREEAEASAFALASRWLAVREWRVVESEDPVTSRLVDGRLETVSWVGNEARDQGWPREACPFYRDGQEGQRVTWFEQWDTAGMARRQS